MGLVKDATPPTGSQAGEDAISIKTRSATPLKSGLELKSIQNATHWT